MPGTTSARSTAIVVCHGTRQKTLGMIGVLMNSSGPFGKGWRDGHGSLHCVLSVRVLHGADKHEEKSMTPRHLKRRKEPI